MKHIAQLLVAAMAAVGAVLAWVRVASTVDVPPIADGQPATVSVVYHPPMLVLVLVLATVAGVLTVLGVAGMRRGRGNP